MISLKYWQHNRFVMDMASSFGCTKGMLYYAAANTGPVLPCGKAAG